MVYQLLDSIVNLSTNEVFSFKRLPEYKNSHVQGRIQVGRGGMALRDTSALNYSAEVSGHFEVSWCRSVRTPPPVVSVWNNFFACGYGTDSCSKVDFYKRGDMMDCLRMGWKWPELRDRLTMLVIVRMRTEEHSLRSQVGIGSKSHCLLGQLRSIFEISDSDAGLKVEKSGGEVGGEGQWGDAMATLVGWEERVRRSLEILSVKKEANLSGRDMDEEEVDNGDVDLLWSSLLTVCQRRRGLVAEEETRLVYRISF